MSILKSMYPSASYSQKAGKIGDDFLPVCLVCLPFAVWSLLPLLGESKYRRAEVLVSGRGSERKLLTCLTMHTVDPVDPGSVGAGWVSYSRALGEACTTTMVQVRELGLEEAEGQVTTAAVIK